MHSNGYRIVFESYDGTNSQALINRAIIFDGVISKPTNCLDLSIDSRKTNRNTSCNPRQHHSREGKTFKP